MSNAPALPPLPQEFYAQGQRRPESKPPIPPLPPNFHPEQPLAAPMPERIMPSLPADMARTLDENVTYAARNSSLHPSSSPYARGPSPGPVNGYPGGFAPPRTGPSPAPYGSPLPPATNARYSSPPSQQPYSLTGAMSGLNIANPPPRASSAQPQYHAQYQSPYPPPQQPYQQSHPPPQQHQAYQPSYPQSPVGRHPGSPGRAPELTAPLPALPTLAAHPPPPGTDPLPWIRDVLFLVDRSVAQNSPGGTPPASGPVNVVLPQDLDRLLHTAAALLVPLASSGTAPPEALYLLGGMHTHGLAPSVPHSPRDAFRLFESAARGGFVKAWFKLGRDYESVGDHTRARDCFERGVRGGDGGCFYRMGMAHLMGQLGLPVNQAEAVGMLHRAAQLANTETPQPAYVYGLLLIGEFSHVRVDPGVWGTVGIGGQGASLPLEARKFIERAAYLGFAPAQYKLGHAYEYALPPFPFDPLLSVQYYSLASQQGEPEADMALSKWFLCGAEGAFDKDENLAWTFADKAARKGLASAEFAMGYYAEVGVGGRKDVEAARKWYAKAVEHGNTDAPERLAALSQPTPQSLSRTEHDAITEDKLVRRRTQARVSAQAAGRVSSSTGQGSVIGRIQAQAQQHPSQPQQHPPQTPQQQHPPPPQQQHQAHPQHQPHAPRYSLTDGGSIPTPAGGIPTPSATPPVGGRVAGRPPGRRPNTTSPGPAAPQRRPSVPAPAPAPGPSSSPALPPPAARPTNAAGAATFAEMGFQSGKADDKECVIM